MYILLVLAVLVAEAAADEDYAAPDPNVTPLVWEEEPTMDACLLHGSELVRRLPPDEAHAFKWACLETRR